MEEWEQRKLIDLGKIVTGNTPKTEDNNYSQTGIPWITPTDIDNGYIKTPSRYLSEEGKKVARILPAGSILVTSIASIGKNSLLKEDSGFNQQINGLEPFPEYDSYYLYTDSYFWSEKMKNIAAAQTMKIVNKSEFSNIKTLVPTKEEQIEIGKLFETFDSLLTLHQR